MKLEVEVMENLISFTNNKGKNFNINTNSDLSQKDISDFINFIQSEHEQYQSKCEYKLIMKTDANPECPREWDNIGTMIGFHRTYNAGDKHNYSSPLELMYDLADEYDSKKTEVLEDLYNDDKLSESDYFKKLKELADKNNLILPVFLFDHSGVSYSTKDFNDSWDSGQVGYIYTSYETIKSEYGDISEDSINKAKSYMEGEVETYSQWANGDVYGFRLIKVDEDGDEIEEIDSCWGFYGSDPKENGIADNIPEEFQYLLKDVEYEYSY